MIVTTKYKPWQFVLEWVTLGIALAWIIAAVILLNVACDKETEILKRNLLMMSIVFQILAYLGFTFMSFLPHGNALIRSKKYDQADKRYQYKRESALRSFALIAKIVSTVILIIMGLIKYLMP